ncbi:MAG: hypothetical protein U1E83_07585 [Methylotetracoccus sp.]
MNRGNGSLPEQVFAAYFYTDDSAREHIRQCLDRAAALAEALRFSASMAGQSGFDVMDRRALEDLASMLKGKSPRRGRFSITPRTWAGWPAASGPSMSNKLDELDRQVRPITLKAAREARQNGSTRARALPAARSTGPETNRPAPHADLTSDPDLFLGLVGDVARATSHGTDVPPVAVAAGFLSFLGANVGRDVYFPIGDAHHHPRLYILHIGRSGRGARRLPAPGQAHSQGCRQEGAGATGAVPLRWAVVR